VLSPVLTTTVPPSPPTHTSPVASCYTDIDALDHHQASPVNPLLEAWSRLTADDSLADIGSPGSEIPSPFLAASRMMRPRQLTDQSSALTSKATRRADQSEVWSDDDDALDGLTVDAAAKKRRGPKPLEEIWRDSENERLHESLSVSSVPAHGQRKDVSTPSKGVAEMLSKMVIAGTPNSQATRSVLRVRDANRSTSSGESDMDLE
jgi:hypothetical protein